MLVRESIDQMHANLARPDLDMDQARSHFRVTAQCLIDSIKTMDKGNENSNTSRRRFGGFMSLV